MRLFSPVHLNCFVRYGQHDWVPARYEVVKITPEGRILEFFEPSGMRLKKPDEVKMASPEEIAQYMIGNEDKVIVVRSKK